MFTKFVSIITLAFVFTTASAQEVTLNALRKVRVEVTTEEEAYDEAKYFKAAVKAGIDDAFADGVTASAVLTKLGGQPPSAKAGWRCVQTTEVIPDAEMSGAKLDGSGIGSAIESVPAKTWVLTNAPEDPQGGEEVLTVKLNCWNVFSHTIGTKRVAVLTHHKRRVLHEGDTVNEETRIVPGRVIRTTRYVRGADRYATTPVCYTGGRYYPTPFYATPAPQRAFSVPFAGGGNYQQGGSVNVNAVANGGVGGHFRSLVQDPPVFQGGPVPNVTGSPPSPAPDVTGAGGPVANVTGRR